VVWVSVLFPLQIILGQFGEFEQVPEQAGLDWRIAVDRDGEANGAA